MPNATRPGDAVTALPFRLAVVIPSLNSPDSLTDLLKSVAEQDIAPSQIVIAAQDRPWRAREIAKDFPNMATRVVSCPRGLSRARNAGIQALTEPWDAVALPDDDVIYTDGAFGLAIEALRAGFAIVSGQVVSFDGTRRLNFPPVDVDLTHANVWSSAMEAGLFVSREALKRTGGFDETLGLGSGTIWNSGEGTDIILRALRVGFKAKFISKICIVEAPAELSSKTLDNIEKAISYAYGTGAVLYQHFSPLRAFRAFGGPLVRALACGVKLDFKRAGSHKKVFDARVAGAKARRTYLKTKAD